MEEATQVNMLAQLRALFVTILLWNEVSDPYKLLLNHRKAMSQDYRRRGEFYQNLCLLNNIEYRLMKHN
ncbi:hypothetical protein NL529_33435, partial [Klebsiella pneumoniae]|nr:hypothetical protein [Klebsiella pneumoniae]